MKLAFIGTHGVGKTTLCYDLASRLKRQDRVVELVMEVARKSPLPINRDTTIAAQSWILHTQIAEEIAASATEAIVICDRSVLDNYAYLVHRAGRQAALDPLVREWVKSYDCLFKVPILGVPTFDGRRDLSPAFQREIDVLIDELAAAFDVRCVALDPAERDGWIDAVLAWCGLPLKAPQIELL